MEKTQQKQRIYGSGIRAITRAALVLAGKISIQEYRDYPVNLHWPNLLPVDDLAAAQTAQILQAIGVSNSTLMQQLGYDPDDEADKSMEEDQRKMTMYSRGQGMPPGLPMNQPPQTVQQDAQMQQTAGESNE
jgi:hypothetical protein